MNLYGPFDGVDICRVSCVGTISFRLLVLDERVHSNENQMKS